VSWPTSWSGLRERRNRAGGHRVYRDTGGSPPRYMKTGLELEMASISAESELGTARRLVPVDPGLPSGLVAEPTSSPSDHNRPRARVLDRLLCLQSARHRRPRGSFVMSFETVLITATRLPAPSLRLLRDRANAFPFPAHPPPPAPPPRLRACPLRNPTRRPLALGVVDVAGRGLSLWPPGRGVPSERQPGLPRSSHPPSSANSGTDAAPPGRPVG